MMEPTAEFKAKAAMTYNAASDHYDDPANAFWARSGSRTVQRLDLRPGDRVLEVCCGTGASAIPAARAVGAIGSVLGVDLADELLLLARAKADRCGLTNVEFRAADLLDLDLPDAGFDAVICVFGIFFVPDVQAAVSALWRLVRPGGKLAVTTWGPRFLEPMSSRFWAAVREVDPDLFRDFDPWDRVSEPATLRSVLTGAGIRDMEVLSENTTQALAEPEDWWSMVLGTGYRGTIEELDAEGRERVRRDNLDFIRDAGVTSVEANVIYATATKDSEPPR
jgi:ubiquinone/menaquinone biosynthesis C-methylase UbiE